ncbi:hypothetical protein ACV229_17665 [Burkholderia sp. MR1-5-21]
MVTRRDTHRYRYASGTYQADIAIDEAGLVIDYDEWRRIGATSPRVMHTRAAAA